MTIYIGITPDQLANAGFILNVFWPQLSFIKFSKNQRYAIPSGKYLLANELMVKTFLLAHNAQKIIIIGNKDKVKAYKNYFLENGVRAKMYLQPLENSQNQFVKLLFFNKKEQK